MNKGVATEGSGGIIWDPDPNDPTGKTALCHTDWPQFWAHRFIAVAVSQLTHGEEDLSKGFHKFTLVDEYHDWPQMTVSDDYLLLNHLHADSVEVFDANNLADPSVQDDNSFMLVHPLATLPYSQFVVMKDGKAIPATGTISLVNQHMKSDSASKGLTYMVGTNGNDLLIFALKSGDPSGKPKFLKGTAVDLGHVLHGIRTNPVFQNGNLYIAGFECTKGTSTGVCEPACQKYVGHLYRVPVQPNADGTAVMASGPHSSGFLEYTIGDSPKDPASYVNTMIEVTANGDMVYAYERLVFDPRQPPQPASVRYATFYRSANKMSDEVILQPSIGTQIPSKPDPGITCGIVDLGGIALDPKGTTVWFSHAYSSSGRYTEVVGVVKP